MCAGIGAWNYPLQGMSWKVAPALAAGNAMVFKPSEETILSSLVLAQIVHEAGAPKGLLNVVLGDFTTGQSLVSHPTIAKVSFTGSVATGARVIATAGESNLAVVNKVMNQIPVDNKTAHLKHITMELGGKSPLIIFEDCDLKEAVSGAMMANFFSNGQVCSNGTRIFVQDAIFDEFLTEFVRRTKKLKVGDPFDETAQMSALISAKHYQKVLDYIRLGVSEGVTLCLGEENLQKSNDEPSSAASISPVIFVDCEDSMRVVKEEIFGPVACVLRFSSYEEVVARANDTPFGLAGGAFTKDIQKAHRIAKDINAGMIWINNFNLGPSEIPWGGNKLSGIGRENGKDALNPYLHKKCVYIEQNKVDCPYE